MKYHGYYLFDALRPVSSTDISFKADYSRIGKFYQKQQKHINIEHTATLKYNFECINTNERGDLLNHFNGVYGSHDKFLMRSYKTDFILKEPAVTDDTSITVEFSKEYYQFQFHAFLIYIEGHSKIYKVIGIGENDPTKTVLYLDSGLSNNIEACKTIEICYLGRWDSDALSFDHDDILYSTTAIGFQEVSQAEFEISV